MPSKKDNEKFTESVFSGFSMLENAIEWIRDNMKPDQVFDDKDLEGWAEDNGFVKEA